MRWILWLLVACSGPRGAGEPHRPHGSATPDAAVAEVGPTQKECEALLAHVIQLGGTEKGDPTADERTTLTRDLAQLPGCQQSTRTGYLCAMAAKSIAEVESCK